MESFSDAVFGFALTLLVVSLDVPRTFADLVTTMRGFPAFALCFLFLRSFGMGTTDTAAVTASTMARRASSPA